MRSWAEPGNTNHKNGINEKNKVLTDRFQRLKPWSIQLSMVSAKIQYSFEVRETRTKRQQKY